MPLGRLIVGVLLPFAAGYHLSYVFRTINALIVDQLSEEIGISPAALGLLTSMYFLVMVAVQLPIGALLDRHGPRRLQVVLLPITALGAVVFALADSVPGLLIGRLLIGLGVSAALMAGLKAASLWFPPERIGMANGLLVMAGSLGAVMAAVPIQALIGMVGWRPVFLLLAVLATFAAATIFVVVPRVVTTASQPKMAAGSACAPYSPTRGSGASRRCRQPQSARPGRFKDFGPLPGSLTSKASITRPSFGIWW